MTGGRARWRSHSLRCIERRDARCARTGVYGCARWRSLTTHTRALPARRSPGEVHRRRARRPATPADGVAASACIRSRRPPSRCGLDTHAACRARTCPSWRRREVASAGVFRCHAAPTARGSRTFRGSGRPGLEAPSPARWRHPQRRIAQAHPQGRGPHERAAPPGRVESHSALNPRTLRPLMQAARKRAANRRQNSIKA